MIHRDRVCAITAAAFTIFVVIPGILIGAGRSLPFEFIDARMMESAASPGQEVDVRYTIRNVTKECSGSVERFFVDSQTRTFFLGKSSTIYHRVVSRGDTDGSFDRQWRIPPGAAPGPGLYIAYPEFWCNPLQQLWPIKAPTQKASITVVRPGQ